MSRVILSTHVTRADDRGGVPKRAWRPPVIQETDVADGTGFACSPCPDSFCATARAS